MIEYWRSRRLCKKAHIWKIMINFDERDTLFYPRMTYLLAYTEWTLLIKQNNSIRLKQNQIKLEETSCINAKETTI